MLVPRISEVAQERVTPGPCAVESDDPVSVAALASEFRPLPELRWPPEINTTTRARRPTNNCTGVQSSQQDAAAKTGKLRNRKAHITHGAIGKVGGSVH